LHRSRWTAVRVGHQPVSAAASADNEPDERDNRGYEKGKNSITAPSAPSALPSLLDQGLLAKRARVDLLVENVFRIWPARRC